MNLKLKEATPGASLLALLLVAALAGCQGVGGSGVAKKESRKLADFNSLDVSGGWELELTAGSAKQSVELSGDDNILPLIKTTVKGEQLVISSTKPIRPKLPLRLQLQLPQLKRLEVSGAVSGQLRGLHGDSFDLQISGAAKLTLRGKVTRVGLEASGAGSINAGELVAEKVSVDLSGAGKAEVNASQSLHAQISGAGSVRYRGNPKDVDKDVSGAGSIEPVD